MLAGLKLLLLARMIRRPRDVVQRALAIGASYAPVTAILPAKLCLFVPERVEDIA